MELNDKTVNMHCLILLLFTCQFQQIHTGNGLVPARHHCRNAKTFRPRVNAERENISSVTIDSCLFLSFHDKVNGSCDLVKRNSHIRIMC